MGEEKKRGEGRGEREGEKVARGQPSLMEVGGGQRDRRTGRGALQRADEADAPLLRPVKAGGGVSPSFQSK